MLFRDGAVGDIEELEDDDDTPALPSALAPETPEESKRGKRGVVVVSFVGNENVSEGKEKMPKDAHIPRSSSISSRGKESIAGSSGGTSFVSDTSSNPDRKMTSVSLSSVGSLASNAVGESVSEHLKEEKAPRATAKSCLMFVPSLFCGSKRPSFLLVMLVFVFIAVAAPASSILSLNVVKVRSIQDDHTKLQAENDASWIQQEFNLELERFEAYAHTNVENLVTNVFTLDNIPLMSNILFSEYIKVIPKITGLLICWGKKLWGRNLTPQGLGDLRTFPNGTLCEYGTDEYGQRNGEVHWCAANYDATTKPMVFKVSQPNGPRSCWTGIYVSAINGLWRTLYSVAWTDDNDEVIAVASVDILISRVGQLLSGTMVHGEGGISCVINDANMILGCSDPTIEVLDKTHPQTIDNSTDSLIRPVSDYIIRKYGSWQQAAALNVTDWVGSKIVCVKFVKRECLTWTLFVIYQPKEEGVDKTALAVALSITAVVLLVGVLISFTVSIPLHTMVQDMHRLTCLRFEQRKQHPILKESVEIQSKYTQLRAGLIAMTKYIPRSVVASVLRNPSQRLLTMETKHLTILFVDIAGFTTMAEAYPRHKVVKLLNQWIDVFTKIVHFNSGTIDKYIGDCIMAIWGAPDDVPDAEFLGVKTALEFMNAVPLLNDHWTKNEFPTINIRVGLHAGSALVGNIGCLERMNYTVCGNAANVAARLEQLGKTLKVTPLISATLAEKLRDRIVCAWVGRIKLKGHKHLKYSIYHVLNLTEKATPRDIKVSSAFHKIEHMFSKESANKNAILHELHELRADSDFEAYSTVIDLLVREAETEEATDQADYYE